MTDPATLIADAIQRREEALSRKAVDERKMNEKLLKRITQASVVKLKPFWWLPAFLKDKVALQKKNSELARSLVDYEEFSKRQSVDMKKLFALCIKHVPANYPGWTEFREYLDPQNIHGKA